MVLGSRSEDRCNEVAERLPAGSVHPFIADLGDADSVDRALDLLDRAGVEPTDIAHCAAGGLEPMIRPLLRATAADSIRKVPGRTEYQRGVVFKDAGEWKVRTTGQQGSGVLRSMVEANCFIVLQHERGAVKAGEEVQVQLMEGVA